MTEGWLRGKRRSAFLAVVGLAVGLAAAGQEDPDRGRLRERQRDVREMLDRVGRTVQDLAARMEKKR